MKVTTMLILLAAQPSGPEVAYEFVTALGESRFQAAVQHFSTSVSRAMPASKLQEVWRTIGAQAGAFQGTGRILTRAEAGHEVHLVLARFERANLDVKVVLDSGRKIAGLFFLPEERSASRPPPYAQPESFTESGVRLGEEPTLQGRLAVPKRGERFPGMV